MRSVRCCECGKHYDYEEDGFCPKCGAFNQPPRSTRIGADGSVVRVDGLNEAGHADSFLHQELHEEARQRRKISFDADSPRRGVKRPEPIRTAREKKPTKPITAQQVLGWIIGGIVFLNLLRILFFNFAYMI